MIRQRPPMVCQFRSDRLGLASAIEHSRERNVSDPAGLCHAFGREFGDPATVAENETEIGRVEDAANRNAGELGPSPEVSDAEIESVRDQHSGDPTSDGVRKRRLAGGAAKQTEVLADLDQLRITDQFERSIDRPEAGSVKARQGRGRESKLLAKGWVWIAVDQQRLGPTPGELARDERRDRGLPHPALAGDRDLQRTGESTCRDRLFDAGSATNSW